MYYLCDLNLLFFYNGSLVGERSLKGEKRSSQWGRKLFGLFKLYFVKEKEKNQLLLLRLPNLLLHSMSVTPSTI